MQCCPWVSRTANLLFITALAGALYLVFATAFKWEPGRLDLSSGASRVVEFPTEAGKVYGLLVSSPRLSSFGNQTRVVVTVTDPSGGSMVKKLHAGDPDLYVTIGAPRSGVVKCQLSSVAPTAGAPFHLDVDFRELPGAVSESAQLGSVFHGTWETAEEIRLGRTVYAAADERPYIPAGSDRKQNPAYAQEVFEDLLAGIHWYKFRWEGPGDRLVHFHIDIQDRDVPADVAVFTLRDGRLVEYTRGRERYETERSTIFHGLQKFQARVISPGIYYVRVMANHPAYQLHTDVYPVPPYTDPGQAVRTAMDYIVRKGDSWHANIPRRGAVVLRNSNPLQETRLCVACHPTHFSTRAELIAVENGYPVRARSSLQFLVERLQNNPRPIYGKPEASWARMIHAPGNVLSRIAYITDKYNRNLAHERREELFRGIAAYLEMYWPGVGEPGHESNGNLPRISGYEVALHNALLFEDLHRRTGEPRYRKLREQIEQVVRDGKVDDMLDLCWKVDALVTFGRDKYEKEISELVERIFSYQRPNGMWPMPFGMEEIQYDFREQKVVVKKLPQLPGQEGPRPSEFQSWHAVYALARAGVTLDDPRLKKAVDLMLSRQRSFGGWQGNPDYKNFDTPFRDTQYAVMALSTLFPGPKGAGGVKGWNDGFPSPPDSFDASNMAETLARLDQVWDLPAPKTRLAIRALLNSPHVLVRYQAAIALGRAADADAVEELVGRLGDSSKLVQRGAALALRQVASRRPEAQPTVFEALKKALRSPDERTRWGAARVFNQHFKYLTSDWELARELIRLTHEEPVPVVKMSAVQALYQWWYWDRDEAHKAAIEEALIAGLGREEHPWVRRNFIEAYYNTLDDNLRYLYGSWIPRVKRPEDKQAIIDGHRAHVRRQAVRYRDAMRNGNALTRDGLLRALYTHHIREGQGDISTLAKVAPPPTVQGSWVNGYRWAAVYDPVVDGSGTFSSIGNDSEGPLFYEDSAPLISEAFLTALETGDPNLITGTLRALKFLRNFPIDATLSGRLLSLLRDAPKGIRVEVAAVATTLLADKPVDPAALLPLIREGDALAVQTAVKLLRDPGPEIQQALSERLAAAALDSSVFPALVAALETMPELRRNEELVAKAVAGLQSRRPSPQRAALRLILTDPEVLNFASVRAAYHGFPERRGSIIVGGALSTLETLDYRNNRYQPAMPEIRRIVLAGLNDPVHTIRTQALDVLRQIGDLHKDDEILARVGALRRDPEAKVRNSALAFESTLALRARKSSLNPRDFLDYQFFKYNVEPILLAKGEDGFSCAGCHANHTIMKLNDADEYGAVTHAQSMANYNAVLNMVDIQHPERSMLLFKPVSPMDDAGIGDSREFSHGGGVRWRDKKSSKEYQVILRWIQGARVDPSDLTE
jgi:hypothetical protein